MKKKNIGEGTAKRNIDKQWLKIHVYYSKKEKIAFKSSQKN